MPRRDGEVWRLAFAAALFALAVLPAAAERLPVTTYGADDGLGHDHLRCARVDSRGLLWFCTANGLARFDGVAFTRFGVADGLPSGRINDLLERPPGRFWIATDRGLFALDATAPATGDAPRFVRVPEAIGMPELPIHALAPGSGDRLWAASSGGLLEVATSGSPEVRLARGSAGEPLVDGPLETLLADPEGALWIAGSRRVARVSGDAAAELRIAGEPGEVRALLHDRKGRLWIGADGGVWRREPGSDGAEPLPAFAGRRTRALLQGSDGTIWVAAVGGIEPVEPAAPDRPARRYTVANGLRDETANALAEDPGGNLWLATDLGGALRLVRGGFVTYDEPDGIGHTSIVDLFEGRRGELYAVGQIGGYLSRFDGGRFSSVRPGFDAARLARLRRSPTHVRQARDGRWWVATPEGLFRFPATDAFETLARTPPERRFGAAEGLAADAVYFTFEDAEGGLWASSAPSPGGSLARLAPGAARFAPMGPDRGAPAGAMATTSLAASDGTLWIGWSGGELARFRAGRLERAASPTTASVADLFEDGRGTLWVATVGDGVWRAADPTAPAPDWIRLGRHEGLASDDTRCLVADRAGRVWIGSVEGVDRLDPESGALRHFSTSDGLAQLETTVALATRDGALWFGTYSGLSRILPETERDGPAPTVWISGLAIDERSWPLPSWGVREVPPLALSAGPHRVRLEYFAPCFSAGGAPRYEVRIDGGAAGAWSPPTRDRSLVLAGLGSGRHRIEVCSVDARGARGSGIASVELFVPPPFWHRTWFFALVLAALAGAFWLGHRLRLRRAIALERVRTRIAADLHDDLGASLARISLLAEVARGAPPGAEGSDDLLGQIGATARGLTARAREIVWSLDPRYDDLASFAVRLREIAGELLDASGVAWSFAAPAEGEARRVALRPELRQHLLLVFKEALHNALRHGRPGRIDLALALRGRKLAGEVRDDGRGFEPGGPSGSGQGLRNLRARIAELGGEIAIDSSPEAGTRIRFAAPLGAGDRTKMRLPRRPPAG